MGGDAKQQASWSDRELLLKALERAGEGVLGIDHSGCVAFLSPVARNLTGWTSQDAAGVPLARVFHTPGVDVPVDKLMTGEPWSGRVAASHCSRRVAASRMPR
jgi:PAS domain-containing protein